eukprot:TRINITY_DN2023_c0_g2_i1.p1 TRINITY_DN2023_c0_g2~~TRINITY_DN2023_c0_g2_i1.p1  ORF type:complete len:798 (-),score=93.03 TRINITY_DN2023_c0_g2_i1:679-2934(-)
MFVDQELEQKRLVKEGLHTLAQRVTEDLQSDSVVAKEQALVAIRDLLTNQSQYPKTAVQNILRERGALSALLAALKLVSYNNEIEEVHFFFPFCVECLLALIDNNVRNKKEAGTFEGVVETVVAELGVRGVSQVGFNLLLVLQSLLSVQEDRDVNYVKESLFRAGGMEILLRYISELLQHGQQPILNDDVNRQAYISLSIIKPILADVQQSHASAFVKFGGIQIVSRLISGSSVKNGATTHSPSSHSHSPSPSSPILSMGLAILEDVVLAYADSELSEKYPTLQELYHGGVLALLLGFITDEQHQSKSLFLLSELCKLDVVLEVLPVLLTTFHYQVLCHAAVAVGCTNGNAVQSTGKWSAKVLAMLIDSQQKQSSLSVLRHLVVGRCVGALLKVGETSVSLIQKASTEQGISLLSSLGCANPLETAIALSQLFPFHPDKCAHILLQQNLISPLVQEFINELRISAQHSNQNHENGLQHMISVESIAYSSPLRQSSYNSLDDSYHQVMYPYRGDAKSSLVSVLACINSSLGQDQFTETPLTYQISLPNSVQLRSQISSVGSSSFSGLREEVNVKRYDTVTFWVGGREFYALGWVLEQQSPLIRDLLQSMKDVRDRIVIPRVSGLNDQQMYQLFQNAVEFAYTGQSIVHGEDILSLWALAKGLQMQQLYDYCALEMTKDMFIDDKKLAQAMFWLANDKEMSRVFRLCMASMVERFDELIESGLMMKIAQESGDLLVSGIVEQIRERLKDTYGS